MWSDRGRVFGALVVAGGLAGCPWDVPSEQSTVDDPSTTFAGGGASGASSADVESAVAAATAARFPPAPDVETLCRLRVGQTDYDAAKKVLGKPQNEAMDAMHASQSYRFSAPKALSAGSGGGAMSDESSVTVYLSFDWSDGSPGAGTLIFGIGGSPQDFLRGYILADASINGLPYPDCWPHEEE